MGAALTHFALADDQVGVAEHLLLVVRVQDLALPQVGRDARGVDDRDELHPEALQGAPALVLVLIVRHGTGAAGVGEGSWAGHHWLSRQPSRDAGLPPQCRARNSGEGYLREVCSLTPALLSRQPRRGGSPSAGGQPSLASLGPCSSPSGYPGLSFSQVTPISMGEGVETLEHPLHHGPPLVSAPLDTPKVLWGWQRCASHPWRRRGSRRRLCCCCPLARPPWRVWGGSLQSPAGQCPGWGKKRVGKRPSHLRSTRLSCVGLPHSPA